MAKRFDTTEATPRRSGAGVEHRHFLCRVHPKAERRVLERSLVLGRDPGGEGWALATAGTSRRHCSLTFVPQYGVYRLRDLESRNGTWLNGVRVEDTHLEPGSVLRVGDSVFVYDRYVVEPGLPLHTRDPHVSPRRARAEALVERAAPSGLRVLLTGPTGAGKERLAQALHQGSGRSGRLVALNCGAFNAELLQAELFGHLKGAFSGAEHARDGLFVAADRGTLFLDEIAELPLSLQPVLLRALQEKRVRPVGSDRDRMVDVRVVAASHQALGEAEVAGRFRGDLHARVCQLHIELPGLAERREEILPIFKDLLGVDTPLSADAAEALVAHDWPHNVRGLQAAVERVRIFAPHAEVIDLALLPKSLRRAKAEQRERGGPDREALEALLREHGGNVAGVARALGQHRQQVYRWLRAHKLDPADHR